MGKTIPNSATLKDCMACYGGFAYFEFDPITDKKSRLIAIDIAPNLFSPTNDKLQTCLKQFIERLETKKTYVENNVEYIQLGVTELIHLLHALDITHG